MSYRKLIEGLSASYFFLFEFVCFPVHCSGYHNESHKEYNCVHYSKEMVECQCRLLSAFLLAVRLLSSSFFVIRLKNIFKGLLLKKKIAKTFEKTVTLWAN